MKTASFWLTIAFSLVWQPVSEVDAQEKPQAKTASIVPVFSLQGPITEQSQQDDLQLLFGSGSGESLKGLIARGSPILPRARTAATPVQY